MGTAIFGDLPGPLPDVSLAGQVLTWNGTEWDLSTGAELAIALADLSDVTATSGTGSTVPFTTSPTFTTPRIITSIDDGVALTKLIEFVTSGTHTGYLQLTSGTGVVGLRATTGANAPLTITADSLVITAPSIDLIASSASVNSNTIETQNNKAAASGYASLSASTLVVQNPANATATATASKIPIADGSGNLDTWISAAGTAGRLKSFQILTSGTTYTRPAGIVSILVEAVSGGGGGGGAAQAAVSAAAGGGGGAGSYAREWFAAAASSYTYAIGAAGAGGTAGNNNGAQGGATSFSTVATIGGAGGAGSPAGTVVAVATGGAGGGVATGADINGGGAPGGFGLTFTGTVAASGFGGSGHFGGGAGAATTERAGFAAAAYGSGGSGGCCLGGTARAGGVGFAGVVYVWEFS